MICFVDQRLWLWHLNLGNEAVSHILQLGTERVNLKVLLIEGKRNWNHLGVDLENRPLDSVIFGDKGKGDGEHCCGATKELESLAKLQIFAGEVFFVKNCVVLLPELLKLLLSFFNLTCDCVCLLRIEFCLKYKTRPSKLCETQIF